MKKNIFILLVLTFTLTLGYSQNIIIDGIVDGLGMHDVKILKKLKKDIEFEGGIQAVNIELKSGRYKKTTKTSLNGNYVFDVPAGKNYTLKISKKGYSTLIYYINSKKASYSLFNLRSIIQKGDEGSYNIGAFGLTSRWISFKENSDLDQAGIGKSNMNLASKTAKKSINQNRTLIKNAKVDDVIIDTISLPEEESMLESNIYKIGEKLNLISSSDSLNGEDNNLQSIVDSAYSVLSTLEENSLEYNELKSKIKNAESKLSDAKKLIEYKNIQIEEKERVIFYITLFVLCLIIIIGLLFLFYKKIQEKNTEIVNKSNKIKSSIEYASIIQKATLTSKESLDSYIPNNFIYYKPKDIVSGDFYWFKKVDGKLVIVASDCTGHGVPGALLTMLGVSALEKIVGQEKETNPEEILKKLDVDISEKLSDGSKYQLNGMDIAVVVIDEKLNQAIYSGAMREITIVDKEGNVNNLKPNFVSIASGRLKGKVKSELINLNKGDCLFLYSDGYQDQFKGNIEKVETYNFKRFQDLLLKLSNQEFKLADIYLEKDLKAWKGDKEQIDDIMIIGLKF